MPIIIPKTLPAFETLTNENIFVMTDSRAVRQDIRPLRILILNLMPKKIQTETQLLRMLSNTPLQVELKLLHTESYESKNIGREHLETFYHTFSEIKDEVFDAMIITGAPVELLEFEEVDYWEELKEIMDFTLTNVFSTMYICWGAQAGLYYHYGIPKYKRKEKLFGVFPHRVVQKNSVLLRGFDDEFYAPHSRYTEVRKEDIEKVPELEILSESDEAGLYIIASKDGSQIFINGHAEYDQFTLAQEYFRDISKGIEIDVPKNYFPQDDCRQEPIVRWKSHANLLFSNWLNYYVYQETPYVLEEIKEIRKAKK